MSTNFPTSIDALTNPTATDTVSSVSHADQHANANDAIEALEAKVGVDSSAVTTSHDYKLGGVTGSDKASSLAGTETLTNKTLTSPTVNTATIDDPTITGDVSLDLTSDAEGDVYYRNASGNLARLGIGTADQFLKVSGGLPAWVTSNASFTIENSSGTTHSLTTNGSQQVIVFAKGQITLSGGASATLDLDYNAVTKDTVVAQANGSSTHVAPFCLMYTETPASDTQNVTVTTSAGTLANVEIIVIKV